MDSIVHADAGAAAAVPAAWVDMVEVAEVVIVPTRVEVGPARHSGRAAIRR